jgi:hypothetical protein
MNRLLELTNYIEQHPQEFNQWDVYLCIVGTGLRLLSEPGTDYIVLNGEMKFAKEYGVSYFNTLRLFRGAFSKIHPNLEDVKRGEPREIQVEKALKVLRYLGNV